MKKSIVCILFVIMVAYAGMVKADSPETNSVSDPAFNVYVNPDTLYLARNTAEASLMVDVALQLAEGEKILLRSHRAISAEEMLKLAAKVAATKGDEETLARLNKATEKLGKPELVEEFSSIAKLVGASRNAEKPVFSTGDDKVLAQFVEGIIDAIDDAALLQNAVKLQKIEQSVSQIPLSEKLAGEITDYIAKLRADKAIAKLDGESRQFSSGSGMRNAQNTSSFQAQTYTAPMVVQDPNARRRAPVQDPNAGGQMGGAPFYSNRLQAQFVVVPNGGRCVTYLAWNSPLVSAGIEVGDIIIRMDGIPVNSDWELNNHYSWTTIDVIDFRSGNQIRLNVYIP